MNKKKVLIIDDMHESISELLSNAGYEPHYRPEIVRSEILEVAGQYEGMIVRSKTAIDRELMEKAVRLEFLGRAGAGIDKIDIAYVQQRGISLVNAPEGNRDALAEHTVGMLLSLLHKINCADSEIRNGSWKREDNRGFELMGKTVGVFGYGFMGAAFASRLSGFGCEVIAYDKYKDNFGNAMVSEVELAEFKANTEILSIHVPLTSETKFLFEHEFLRSFPKLKVVINTARGKVLKLHDLVGMLENGHLFGACLDVLENEKLGTLSEQERNDFERLTKLKNVILTPHVAGWTHESYRKINEVLVDKIKAQYLATNHD